ncbi:hypothetical protein MTBPR1_20084 [Candidatus Terasakiella magnetica]|uniref:Methyltransferase type 11 domain-containing protein n=1 Tax=Candidatus Terasakiella magnetica TaxID=1867952 RepID=A0A1C3RG08_9PROT|nr:class I SAM-dependent methyltransferase [Candidatus Terasakiella magnetica]SCA56236.1 hypothetical protein MTBPR1_20084 [Candidatus Terasakiella magnetica]
MAFGYFPRRSWLRILKYPIREFLDWKRGQDNLIKRMHVEETFRLLDLSKTDDVLELGAGGMHYTGEIAKCVNHITALDHVEGFGGNLRIFRFPDNIKCIKGDVHDLPFEDNSFDKCFISEVFSVIPHPEQCLAEVYRVLKPGGMLLKVHGDAYPNLEKAAQTEKGKAILAQAKERWGIKVDPKSLRQNLFATHSTNPDFFEDLEGTILSLFKNAGFTVDEVSWKIGEKAQIEYCYLMFEALVQTGKPILEAGQVEHLNQLKEIDQSDMPYKRGFTMFCKGHK